VRLADHQFCRVARDGRVLIVTLNRPEVMNALHRPAHYELDEVWNGFAADPELWVAIVTGAGDKAFCAGNDLKYQAAGGQLGAPPSGFAGLTQRFDLVKPVIAAVNGVAMGGGFEVALACDLIVAGANAVFALPEPRVGLAALAGGLHRLPRMIPLKQAMGMILTGRRVGAEEGEMLGFVNEVVPQGEAVTAARRLADQILECSPISIRASKETVYRSLDTPGGIEAALKAQREYPTVAALAKSEDRVEGPKAFAEKRKPQWKGR
jgi:enoyl-CoA hydratase/carnithine racemase